MPMKLIAFNGRFIHSCLALFYVREELARRLPGVALELHQYTINDPYYPTLQRIAAGKPEALFFSAYIWNSALLVRHLTDLVLLLPGTPLIIGGPQAGALKELGLSSCTFVMGEIEGVSREFYQDLRSDRLRQVYRAGPASDFPSPYRETDLTGELSNRHLYYESSRGCPFACSYCLSSLTRGVRHKPISQVKKELSEILRHRPQLIKFIDRTFNDLPERTLAIWRFLVEHQGDESETVCHFEMAPDRFTEEMFDFLAGIPAGFFQFEIGIQTTNPASLTAINRRMDLDRARLTISRLAGLNTVHLHVDLILGLPHETEESFRRSINEVFAMGPHYLQMGLLKVLPDTPINRTPSLVHCRHPPHEILSSTHLSSTALAQLFWLGETIEAFHNNRYFTTVFRYLRESGEEPSRFFEELTVACRQRSFFEKSPTQELMSRILARFAEGRVDRRLFLELLAFDWLKSGNRFLPEHLPGQDFGSNLRRLKLQLPQNLPPLFTYRDRDEFFKRGLFAVFSPEVLRLSGLIPPAGSGVMVCFLFEKQRGIYPFQKIRLFADPDQSCGSDEHLSV